MKYHTGRKLHGNVLQGICLKLDFFCALLTSVNVSGHIRIGKRHGYIWDLRLSHAIVI